MASSITISGLHAGYGSVRVIEDVSLNVAAGETVALLGTNGNGKSTLMKCIMGLVRPSAGSIVADIDGTPHDLTRLIVLVAGQKIADGAPQDVVRNPEVERAYLGE